MITEAAKRVASLAGSVVELPLGRPSFRPADRYKAKDFDTKNFQPIATTESDFKIAFIDGGNLSVIEAPSFAVQFERAYFNCFDGEKRAKLDLPNKIEFFAVVTSSGGDEVKYKTHLIPLVEEYKRYLPDEKDLVFDSYDETLRTGLEQIEIPRIGEVARSFAEWNLAKLVAGELEKGDILVRDGTLHAPYTNEMKYAEAAYEAAKRNGALFCGVAKTSHLYTTTGLPLVAAIGRLARENHIKAPGYYENIVDITDPAHRADISFARLHARSQNTLRVEILKGQEGEKPRIMSALAANSRDVSFPGYPYGLIDADKNARVSYGELDALRMLLLSEISKAKKFGEFKDFLAATDAHDWLNKIV